MAELERVRAEMEDMKLRQQQQIASLVASSFLSFSLALDSAKVFPFEVTDTIFLLLILA
jgi:hypothetical protein